MNENEITRWRHRNSLSLDCEQTPELNLIFNLGTIFTIDCNFFVFWLIFIYLKDH